MILIHGYAGGRDLLPTVVLRDGKQPILFKLNDIDANDKELKTKFCFPFPFSSLLEKGRLQRVCR